MKNTSKETVVKTKMAGKTKLYWLVLLVGVALTVGGLVYKNKGSGPDLAAENWEEKEDTDKLEVEKSEDSKSATGNYLEGKLENSDDTSRGNFKLVSSQSDIYLRTSRDFSKFVGLQVLVLINGTVDKFELMDIQTKIEKDGYIQAQ